jgi:hypothetical protein
MAGMKIIIEMKGMLADEGQVRAEDFVTEITAIIEALKQTDRIVSKKEEPTVSYRIVDVGHSNLKVALGLFPINIQEDYSDELGKMFLTTIENIVQKEKPPPEFDYDALEAYKNIGKKIDRGFSYLALSANGYHCDIPQAFSTNIQIIQGPDEVAQGSLSGRIEAINFHSPPYRFTLYPIVGPQSVRCNFPPKKKIEAISAIDKYVTVFGTIKYRYKSMYPYQIDVAFIEINPTSDELPKLSDLKGIAPNITGGLTSEEFVRRLRDIDG